MKIIMIFEGEDPRTVELRYVPQIGAIYEIGDRKWKVGNVVYACDDLEFVEDAEVIVTLGRIDVVPMPRYTQTAS